MLILMIISFVQIVLESLPVSSSGHVQLVLDAYEKYFPIQNLEHIFATGDYESWFHSIHIFTAIIVAAFFFHSWYFLLTNIARTWRIILKLMMLALLADIITYGWYFVFKLCPIELPLVLGFGVTTLLLVSLYFLPSHKKNRSFNARDALLLGIVQGITLLPGISRFAATFVAARWLGYSGERAFTLTWMIQWPLIAAASLLGFYELGQAHLISELYSMLMLMVYVCAALISYGWFVIAHRLAISDRFWWFAFYMPIVVIIALSV